MMLLRNLTGCEGDPTSWAVVAMLLVAMVVILFNLVPARWVGAAAKTIAQNLTGPSFAAAFGGAAVYLLGVQSLAAKTLRSDLWAEAEKARQEAEAVTSLLDARGVMLFAAIAAAIFLLRSFAALSEKHQGMPPWLARLGMGAGVLSGAVVAFAMHLGYRILVPRFHYCTPEGDVDPDYRWRCLHGLLVESLDATRWSRPAIIGIAATASLLAVGIVVTRARHRARPAGLRLAPGVMVMAAGLLAFGITRNHAWDARHLMPLHSEPDRSLQSVWSVPDAPPRRCERLRDGPTVTLRDNRASVDGIPQPTRSVREALQRKRELFAMLNPGRPLPGIAVFEMPAATPMKQILPVFHSAAEAGYTDIAALTRLPARYHDSRTLGRVPYSARFCEVRLDPMAPPPEDATWGAIVERAAAEP